MSVGTFFQLVNKPAIHGIGNSNLLLHAYQIEASRLEKADNDTIKDVNIGNLQESIQREEEKEADEWNILFPGHSFDDSSSDNC